MKGLMRVFFVAMCLAAAVLAWIGLGRLRQAPATASSHAETERNNPSTPEASPAQDKGQARAEPDAADDKGQARAVAAESAAAAAARQASVKGQARSGGGELLRVARDGWVALDGGVAWAGNEVEPRIERSDRGYRIHVAVPGFQVITRTGGGESYAQVDIPGFSRAQDAGYPSVPVRTFMLEIPHNVNPSVAVVALNERRVEGLKIWPAQPPLPDVSPEPPPPPFQRDDKTYGANAFYPENNILSYSVAQLRNRRLLVVEVAPLRANPLRGEALVADSIEVKVAYEMLPGTPEPGPATKDLKSEVLKEGFAEGAPSKYMILMDDQFTNNALLATFADWKRRKGYDVAVVKTSDIDASGAPTNGQIVAYMRALSAADYPEYLLIVGDHTAASGVAGAYFNTDTTDYYGYTDLDIACRTSSDYLPDLYYGRIPATNSANLSNMLSKVILMDRTPPTNNYYQKVCIAGQIQDSDDNNNVADRLFCETADSIACYFEQDAGGVDYTCTRALVNPDGVASTCRWNSSSILWNSTDQVGTRIWNHFVSATVARNRISSNVNHGVVILQHRDHGYVSGVGWADPDYQTSHVNALTNGIRRPVVFSINCNSGMYQYSGNFTRAWLQHANGGAYAVFAPVDTSYSWYNDWLTHGFYTAFLSNYVTWHNASTDPDWPRTLGAPGGSYGAAGSAQRLGQVLNFGKMYMRERYYTHETTFRLFHLFGDPESYLQLLEPADQSVSHPAVVDFESPDVTVQTGEAGSQVCLYSELLQVQEVALTTGALGTASFTLDPVTTGTVYVTVTKWGCRPYEGSLDIGGDAPAFVRVKSHAATESGDGDGYIEPGETAELSIVLENAGGADASNVSASLTNESAYLVVEQQSRDYGDLAQGESATNGTPFVVGVRTNCPAGAQTLRLIIESDEAAWTNSFNLDVARVPTIGTASAALELRAVQGASDDGSIVISNTGSDTLTFSITDSVRQGATNYTIKTSNESGGPSFSWVDISSSGTAVSLSDDGESALLEIGFPFPFYGESRTQFMIGANGVVSFGSGQVDYNNALLPSSAIPEPSVAVFWDDLNPGVGGQIRYALQGGNLIVSWLGVPRYGASESNSFQVIVSDSGEIKCQYLSMTGTLDSATIGIQASSAGPSALVAYNSAYATSGLAVSLVGDNVWLEYDVSEVALEPGCSTSIVVTARAALLEQGVHTAEVVIVNNDPLHPEVVIPLEFTVTSPLPEPWSNMDIGVVSAAGRATWTAGVFNVLGSGADIEGWDGDEFHFVYRACSGDVQIVGRVLSQDYTDEWAKSGVMMRESSSNWSRHAMMAITPGNRWQFMARPVTGGGIEQANDAGALAPYWVKLSRSGQAIVGFTSPDGTNWTLRGSQVFTNMPDELMIGMPVCSHSDGVLCTVEFDGVRIGAADLDGDGIPDWWERAYFDGATNADAGTDSDDDGQSNFEEWLTGCSPTNSESVFRARCDASEGAGAGVGNVIRWPSAADRVYGVFWATNLQESFETLAADIPATPAENVYTDETHAVESSIYYRVRVRNSED